MIGSRSFSSRDNILLECHHPTAKKSNVVFQRILQHIWSHATLYRSNNKSVSVGYVESQKDKVAADVVEIGAIRQHAGWDIKRARDTILSSPTKTKNS